LGEVLLRLLGSPNLGSKRWVYEQYDYLVGGNTVAAPGSADAAVVRIKGSDVAVVLSVDCNSRYCRLDPYRGAVLAVAEGARNVAVCGGRAVAITDCLNFGNPERPEVMWQFEQSVAGIREACLALGEAVVSGNVSFYNETEGRAIPPTPTIATVGLLDDVRLHLTQWFKDEGDVVAVVGETRDELGGSAYLALVHGRVQGMPPDIDLEREKRLHEFCRAACRQGLLRSAHDVSEGGLAVALAQCCISRPGESGLLGVRATMDRAGHRCRREDGLLFGESQSRAVVSCRRRDLARLEEVAGAHRVEFAVLGEVGGTELELEGLLSVPISTIVEVWQGALERSLFS
jgi:phosphoribosylformylglycinamidine synthase